MGQIRGVIGGFNGPGFRSQGLGKVSGTRGFLSNNLPFRNKQGLTPYDYPFELFANGEQGAWYDPSDFSTMYQDSGGTTPVTAVEQPVGMLRDKSGRGNHAIQATSANRPVLSARYNLLTSSEDFTAGAWGKTALTATPNATQASNGTLTATALTSTINGNAAVAQNKSVAINTSHVFRGEFKAGTVSTASFGLWDNTLGGWLVIFNIDLTSGIATLASGAGTAVASNLGNGWWSFSITVSTGSNSSVAVYVYPKVGGGASIGDSIYSSRIDLRTAADAAIKIPSYQRVNTNTDYDTAGFPYYLAFNGTNSSMATAASVDLTGTQIATAWAGITKNADTPQGTLVGFGSGTGLPGTFDILVNSGWVFRLYGATGNDSIRNSDLGVVTRVLSCVLDNRTDSGALNTLQPRVNGAIPTLAILNDTGTQPQPLANNTIQLGGVAGQFSNSRIYQAVLRGAQSSATEVSNTEAFINNKMGGVF